MYFYYFLMRRYQHHWQQLKCLSVFLAMSLPVFVLVHWIRPYSQVSYHIWLFAMGWFAWTFAEYMLHRFWMHHKNRKPATRLAQSHQRHHEHPTEIAITHGQRLAMVLLTLSILYAAVRLQNFFTFFAGVVAGIAGYFFMHQLLHQKIAQKLFRRLLRYHMYHHCKYPNTCFGITVTWWDDLFGTVPPNPKNISDRIMAFYYHKTEEHQRLQARHAKPESISQEPALL